jgi:hypothetical protein
MIKIKWIIKIYIKNKKNDFKNYNNNIKIEEYYMKLIILIK